MRHETLLRPSGAVHIDGHWQVMRRETSGSFHDWRMDDVTKWARTEFLRVGKYITRVSWVSHTDMMLYGSEQNTHWQTKEII